MKIRLAFLAVSAICFSACSLPDYAALIRARSFHLRPAKFVGTEGPLSPTQGRAILSQLEQSAGQTDILHRHIAFEQAISGLPLSVGNKVTLLQDGPSTYQAMFSAIESATDSINLETYIFTDDMIGQRFADALIAKQKQGVQVNVIYDSLGSFDTPDEFFDRLTGAGIKVLEFNPLNPLEVKIGWAAGHRDHRKLMVIDGKTAFTGGINISGVYSEGIHRRRSQRPVVTLDAWRDTDVEITGPAVAEAQKLFISTWESQAGEPLAHRNYFPTLENQGPEIVRWIGTLPKKFSLIYITLLSAINNAESKVYITDPYFTPERKMLDALEAAARRGVEVRLLVPGRSDHNLILYATRSHYSELLGAGVKIYEWRGVMLHAKTATIDDVWSTVGSSNLDWWSIDRNDEINAVIIGLDFAQKMDAMFQQDMQTTDRIESTQWDQRPFTDHLKENLGRTLEPLL